MRRALLAFAGAATLAVAAWGAWRHAPRGARAHAAPAPAPSAAPGAQPVAARVTGRLARRGIVESSGAAPSAVRPGVFYTVNDAGNAPELFAFDTSGADRGRWRVRGATNVDWEAVALGPCGSLAARCVYVGDVGDNEGAHATRTIYRVPEPLAGPSADARDRDDGATTARAERLTYRYADGAQDVEGMWVTPDGAVHLVTKRRRAGAGGRLRPALVYRLPASAWASATSARAPAVAALVDSIPAIVPGSATLRAVSDAALSPDGTRLAVRTYLELYLLAVDPRTGRLRGDVPPRVCDLVPLAEEQGEGLAWLGPDALLLTSEGRGAPIHVVTCPARRAAPPR